MGDFITGLIIGAIAGLVVVVLLISFWKDSDDEKCPYCQNDGPNRPLNYDTDEFSDMTIKIAERESAIVCSHRDLEGGAIDSEDRVMINYCPICGRDLLDD